MVVVFKNKSTTLRDWVRTLEPSAVKVEIYLDSPRMKGMYSFCMMSLLGCPVNRRTVPLPWVLHPWHVMLMSYRRKSGQLCNFATYNSLCSNIIMYDWRSKPKTFAHVTLMSCMAMKVEDIYLNFTFQTSSCIASTSVMSFNCCQLNIRAMTMKVNCY